MKLRSSFALVLFTTILAFVAPKTSPAQLNFSTPDSAIQSGATTVADFNRDGISDVAVAVDGKVIIYLSPGDGNIGPATEFPGGSKPTLIIPADFNHDGIADLAELGQDGSITVLLGHGDGTFSAPIVTVTGLSQFVNHSMAANDFNGDGFVDLALSSRNTITVLLGHGDGTFEVSSFTVATSLFAIEAADFDGDGNVDLAVVTCEPINCPFTDIQLLPGHGDGTFGPLVKIGGIFGAFALTSADLNNDGHPDLLVPFSPPQNNPIDMAVFMNRGDGTFAFTTTLFGGSSVTLPAVADFNRDGIPDVAFESGSTVHVYLGNGDGSFSGRQDYAKGPGYLTFTNVTMVGDFNGDGILDLAAANDNNTITLLLGIGDGSFSMFQRFRTGAGPTSAAAADFNGDGIPDLVITNADSDTVSLLLGNGDGTFQPKSDTATGHFPGGIAIGDFNGDGAPDVAVANNNPDGSVSILLNDGAGNLSQSTTLIVGQFPSALVVADFNGDGVADLAVASIDNTISVFLGNGDGSFGPKMSLAGGNVPKALAAGDFNQDGNIDLAIADAGSPANITILLGNGDGTFRPGVVLPAGPPGPRFAGAVTVADFNRDGIPDLAWDVSRTGEGGFATVALGNGDGSFGPAQTFPVGRFGPTTIHSVDINGDGIPDLVVAGMDFAPQPGGAAFILLGNGDGTFQPAVIVPATGGGFVGGVVADFNGDGLPDIGILVNSRGQFGSFSDTISDTIAILLNFSR